MGEKIITKSAGIVSISPLKISMCGVSLKAFVMAGNAGATKIAPKIVIVEAEKSASLKLLRSVTLLLIFAQSGHIAFEIPFKFFSQVCTLFCCKISNSLFCMILS